MVTPTTWRPVGVTSIQGARIESEDDMEDNWLDWLTNHEDEYKEAKEDRYTVILAEFNAKFDDSEKEHSDEWIENQRITYLDAARQ